MSSLLILPRLIKKIPVDEIRILDIKSGVGPISFGDGIEKALEEIAKCFRKYHSINDWRKTIVVTYQLLDRTRRINVQAAGDRLLDQVETNTLNVI